MPLSAFRLGLLSVLGVDRQRTTWNSLAGTIASSVDV